MKFDIKLALKYVADQHDNSLGYITAYSNILRSNIKFPFYKECYKYYDNSLRFYKEFCNYKSFKFNN